ncbi:MAG: ADP-ribosylation factor-like protein [Candidatus Kariarchaeaceae archaeon]
MEQNVEESLSIKDVRATLLRSGLKSINWPEGRKAKILVVGLSGAGKSTLIEFLDQGSVSSIKRTPTLAFSFHKINFGRLEIILIDVPGQQAYWKQWQKYLKDLDGMIFVVDSTQFKSIVTVGQLFHQTMVYETSNVPVLFLANKQDLESALSADAIMRLLSFQDLQRVTKAFDVSVLSGTGVYDAFKWLILEARYSITKRDRESRY